MDNNYRFGEDVEYKKLEDIIKINSGKDYKHLYIGDVPVYGSGGYMTSVDRSISEVDAIGIGRKGTIDKPFILNYPFWTVDTLFWCVPEKEYDFKYVYYLIQSINFLKYNEGSTLPSLSASTLNTIKLYTHKFNIQNHIGELLSNLDDQISNYTKQKELLEQKKKYYLNVIFNDKNGDNYRLGEIATIGSGKSKNDNGQYKLYGSTGQIGTTSIADYSGIKNLIARVGANTGYNYYVESKYIFGVSDNTIIVDANEKVINSKYLYYYFKYFNLNRLSFGSGQPLITSTQLKNIKIKLPEFSLQKSNADFLTMYDELIINYTKQKELLEQKKKYYLNVIFNDKFE